ncbi:MAG: TPM domain-containing protein [Clostridia bacterium]|nr:TPM domain-containing protein [Clostridia bacterium]
MKKLITLVIVSVLAFTLSFSSFAAYDYSGGERTSLLYDLANIINDADEPEILTKLEEISASYECEIAILTVYGTEGKDITAFADDYYDYNGFGYGENDDGLILVVDMAERNYAISTYGTAIEIFNDHNLNYLENNFLSYLSDGDYYQAAVSFTSCCGSVLADYENYLNSGNNDTYYNEEPFDDEYYNDYYSDYEDKYTPDFFNIKWFLVAIVIGVIIAFIYTASLKSQLKTVRSKASAKDYVIPGSLHLTQQRDVFMYSNVKKIPKPKENSSKGSRGGTSFGGGSSTHRSSSGRSHGGSRGSF